MNLWETYKSIIQRNCLGSYSEDDGLPYWQNRLFATIMLYFFPLSFLALIPGIIMSLLQGLYLLAAFDALAVAVIAVLSLCPGPGIVSRKIVFIAVFYFSSVFLLYYLGSFGPGLLYLLATTLFTILIFPKKAAFASMLINLAICFAFGVAIHMKAINGLLLQYSVGSWIAVSSNLIVLDAVILFLLPMIFKGLQATIVELQLVKSHLKNEQQSLNKTLELVKTKNAELEQFAYMASHDLQEPLRMISKFLAELDKKYAPQLDDKARRYIGFAHDGAERMKRNIADLLDYSVAGKKQSEKEQIDMNVLLAECLELNRIMADEAGASVTWQNMPAIYAGRLPMQQLFQNLINNAIKYRKPNLPPQVSITAAEDTRYWTFTIADNGIGIDEAHFESIFTVFRRLHTQQEYAGNGIGLAICKKIVESHNGKIWLRSVPGEGTSFIVSIKKPVKLSVES